ncbi:MAG: hypothetical protein ACOYNC_14865 [Bacteroidales bacterium]
MFDGTIRKERQGTGQRYFQQDDPSSAHSANNSFQSGTNTRQRG